MGEKVVPSGKGRKGKNDFLICPEPRGGQIKLLRGPYYIGGKQWFDGERKKNFGVIRPAFKPRAYCSNQREKRCRGWDGERKRLGDTVTGGADQGRACRKGDAENKRGKKGNVCR